MRSRAFLMEQEWPPLIAKCLYLTEVEGIKRYTVLTIDRVPEAKHEYQRPDLRRDTRSSSEPSPVIHNVGKLSGRLQVEKGLQVKKRLQVKKECHFWQPIALSTAELLPSSSEILGVDPSCLVVRQT